MPFIYNSPCYIIICGNSPFICFGSTVKLMKRHNDNDGNLHLLSIYSVPSISLSALPELCHLIPTKNHDVCKFLFIYLVLGDFLTGK